MGFYTRDLADRILARLSAGETLRSITREDGMPSSALVRLWVNTDHDGFAARYQTARENQAHSLAEQALEIVHTEPDPQRARVLLDAHKWFTAKTHPVQFGDQVQVHHTADPIKQLTVEQITALIATAEHAPAEPLAIAADTPRHDADR